MDINIALACSILSYYLIMQFDENNLIRFSKVMSYLDYWGLRGDLQDESREETSTRRITRLPVRWLSVFYLVRILFLATFLVIVFLLQCKWLHILVKEARDRPQRAVARRPRTVRREPLHSWRVAHCPINAPHHPTKRRHTTHLLIPSQHDTKTRVTVYLRCDAVVGV